MDPITISALIGLAGTLLGKGMEGEQAKKNAPGQMLQSINPASGLQNLQMGFNVPGMQGAGGRSMGQQLLGGM